MRKIAVVAAKRTPTGGIVSELSHISDVKLLAHIFSAAVCGINEDIIDYAIVGSSFPVEHDNLCRKALLEAGLSPKIGASTISKTCASSDEAFAIACDKILAGKAKTVLVGGAEKISNSPYILQFMKRHVKNHVKGTLPLLCDIQETIQENDMSYICETLSKKYSISREKQDWFAVQSWKKAASANANGYFKKEIAPIKYEKDGVQYSPSKDETLLDKATEEDVRNATPMFVKDGVLTQYNIAQMNDCAAAIVLMEHNEAKRQGLKPLAYVHDTSSIGVEASMRGLAMDRCILEILKKNKLEMSQIGLFELNESFAAQAIMLIENLGIDLERVNVNGGNLALGYPIGATGMRMYVTLLHEMKRRKTQYGLSSMCAGGNMAHAVIFRNEELT